MRLEDTSCLHTDKGGVRLFLDGVPAMGPVRMLLSWPWRWPQCCPRCLAVCVCFHLRLFHDDNFKLNMRRKCFFLFFLLWVLGFILDLFSRFRLCEALDFVTLVSLD